MLKSEKEELIKELNEKFARAKTAIVAEFSKLDVETVTKLRKKLREGKVEYKVLKNTLAKRAAKGTPVEVISEDFTGPVAMAHQLRRRGCPGEDPHRVHQGPGDHQGPERGRRGREDRRSGCEGAGEDAGSATSSGRSSSGCSPSRRASWSGPSRPRVAAGPRHPGARGQAEKQVIASRSIITPPTRARFCPGRQGPLEDKKDTVTWQT